MEVRKIIFLSKWVICRFHVNLPRCNCLTWPMAKRLKLFGITYSIGKISRSNGFISGWLSKLLVWVLVVWIPGIPENERDWDPWVYP